jgi:outer membrane protein TolC
MKKLMMALAAALAVSGAGAATTLPLAGDLLYGLPPEPVVRRVLEELPALRLGTLGGELAAAEQARLAAGSAEWIVRGGASRRSVLEGQNYREQELGLERTVRWFGKAAQDRAIGEKGQALAEAQRADVWHEACRTLMQDWFDALRAQAVLQRLTEQHGLVQRLRAVAERRVKAGESPALELVQADTELHRFVAQLEQAQQDVAQALDLLATSYRHLPLPQAAHLPEPQADGRTGAEQIERITADNHELELAQVEAQWYGLKARRTASDRMPDPTIAIRATRERDGQEKTLGLTLSIPLPGPARSAEASAAAVRARMADERVDQVRSRVQLAAQRAVSAQRHSYQIWTSLRDVATQSLHQARLMERAYQAGEASLTDTLLSQRQALDAALAAQTAQVAALAASARVQLDAHALWAID